MPSPNPAQGKLLERPAAGELILSGVKQCRKCRLIKPADEFPKRRSASDGLHSWCKVCMADAAADWRERNPEKVAEYEERRDYIARDERRRERERERVLQARA
jgi:hypothetical protein